LRSLPDAAARKAVRPFPAQNPSATQRQFDQSTRDALRPRYGLLTVPSSAGDPATTRCWSFATSRHFRSLATVNRHRAPAGFDHPRRSGCTTISPRRRKRSAARHSRSGARRNGTPDAPFALAGARSPHQRRRPEPTASASSRPPSVESIGSRSAGSALTRSRSPAGPLPMHCRNSARRLVSPALGDQRYQVLTPRALAATPYRPLRQSRRHRSHAWIRADACASGSTRCWRSSPWQSYPAEVPLAAPEVSEARACQLTSSRFAWPLVRRSRRWFKASRLTLLRRSAYS
jgi:hypothetical protein